MTVYASGRVASPGARDATTPRRPTMGTMIDLKAGDGHAFKAYLAEPAERPRGGIVVLQEIFGVNSHIRSVADGYAADGYLTIAPSMFDRARRGYESGYTQEEIQAGVALMQKIG